MKTRNCHIDEVFKTSQDMSWRSLQDVLETNMCLLEYIFVKHLISSKLVYRGHPFSTYAIFVNKMTPSTLWYAHVHFVIAPFPCVRTNLLYPPPPPPLLFYVKSNISFKHFSDLGMQLTIFQKIITFQFFLCTSHIYNKIMFSK